MSSVAFELAQGDLSDFVYVRPEALAGAALTVDWTCSGIVYDLSGNTVVPEFAITEKSGDSTEFKAYISPTQSELITIPGTYVFAVRVENPITTPPVVKTTLLNIQVKANASLKSL